MEGQLIYYRTSCVHDGWGITEWILEDPKIFSHYVRELYAQFQGEEGKFILADGEKELSISKEADLIYPIHPTNRLRMM